jgi:hypothetical protein
MGGIDNKWQGSEETYHSFLLRCWQEVEVENGGKPDQSLVWRFALVQLNDQSSKKGFACLEELFDYLRGQLRQAGEQTKNLG